MAAEGGSGAWERSRDRHVAKPCLPCSKAMFRATCHVNAEASSGNASSNGSCCIFVYQARVPTVALHTPASHTEKKCKMAQGSKQVWESRPRLKRNMPRLRKSRSRSKKSDPRSKKSDPRSKKRGKVKKKVIQGQKKRSKVKKK